MSQKEIDLGLTATDPMGAFECVHHRAIEAKKKDSRNFVSQNEVDFGLPQSEVSLDLTATDPMAQWVPLNAFTIGQLRNRTTNQNILCLKIRLT